VKSGFIKVLKFILISFSRNGDYSSVAVRLNSNYRNLRYVVRQAGQLVEKIN
jgi:hypothetical protein